MSDHAPFLVYGSYGYTGELIVRRALERGLRPILAGRSREKLERQAADTGLEFRAFALDQPADVDAGLDGCKAVIHSAGPFEHTCRQMGQACLRKGVHYLDITGEIIVFETMAAMDAKAREAGIMLMPGTGFDVVPSDCLALHLKQQMPEATDLTLAFYGSGGLSHGTTLTMTENIPRGGAIRKDGKITKVPSCWQVRDIDFGERTETCMTIPWGDVSTAWYSTGIPNIKVFMAAPPALRNSAKLGRYIAPLLGTSVVQNYMKSKIKPGGPSDNARAKGYSLLWGEVRDARGNVREARLRTCEGYTLTAITAVIICERVLRGDAPAGFQTPAKAYGADLILEAEGSTREG
ncbi:MAG: NAD(P)H-binding protein [Candidatus Hydrogenedens sp.]|nr:NAD(P)H-binding protein [Candidatus Hydrogenedens sp.]